MDEELEKEFEEMFAASAEGDTEHEDMEYYDFMDAPETINPDALEAMI
jgi:hypothetical protein